MTSVAVDGRSEARALSGWAYPVLLWQPRNPAYWLYAWFLLNGAFLYVKGLMQYTVAPGTIAIAVFLQALFALPFVWFFTRADRYEREPAKLALLGFLWGGLVSTWMMAAPANPAVISIYAKLFGVGFAQAWGPALTAPFTEEIAKLTGVVVCILLARQHVRSAYDGMILGMFVGLGFQVFENVQYMVSAVQTSFNSDPIRDLMTLFVVRSVSGFAGHWLFTALTGAGLGYLLGATDRPMGYRVGVFLLFLVFSMLCHGVFDAAGALGPAAPILASSAMVIGGVVAWQFAGRRVRTWMRELLGGEVANGTITAQELGILASPQRARRRYLKRIKKEAGSRAAKKAGWILDGAIELADAIAVTDDPDSPQVEAARAEVARLRGLPNGRGERLPC